MFLCLLLNLFEYRDSQICLNCESKIFADIMSGVAPTTAQWSQINVTTPYKSGLRPTGVPEQKGFTKEGALVVYSIFSLKQIVSFDERNQVLTTNFYLLIGWADPRCSWDLAKYGYTQYIIAPASSFWLPDLAILNAASGESLIKYSSTQGVAVLFDGSVWMTLAFPSQATKCKLNVYNYPFDTQTCSIKIGSWMSTTYTVVYNNYEVDLSKYSTHPIWSLKSILQNVERETARLDLVNFYVRQQKYFQLSNVSISSSDLSIDLTLKRSPLYIMINGVLPCFVLNLVVLIAFSMPFATQIGLCKL